MGVSEGYSLLVNMEGRSSTRAVIKLQVWHRKWAMSHEDYDIYEQRRRLGSTKLAESDVM